jgi:hypothetical protein
MGEETEVRGRGEIHRRRDGGKETEGTDLWERQRGHAREEREEGGGEEGEGKMKGKGKGRGRHRRRDTGRGIGGETYES